ncbi:hypothetical protein LTR62_002296 [Meristemomyces frigidus]|uniref:CRAL-TRIO domain-containing protein n=1 Tax=Meristemomyces frigidus TaxID=1508187 RepID=A0AAN7TRQ9_9PEZI|nr:hypothetical protein LTR62_002296 [Meristemomyces frigidus]
MAATQPDGAPLQRVESYQWPTGHVAHLSGSQQSALQAFKTLCEQKKYYVPESADGRIPATHDEETLLRYLRARKFIPQEAFKQFKDTEDWRKENQLDRLYETIDVHEYDMTRRVYPQWTGRRDKRGIPLYVYQVSQVSAKDVDAHGKESKKSSSTSNTPPRMLRLFALYENLCRFVLPLCSAMPDRAHGETPISQSNNIVDISKVSMAKFWSLRNHMSDASTLATAHYPETLDRIFVVGAPGFFSTVWGWAKNWFDPITVSKIFILNDKTMLSTMEKFIDRANIPKKYGGDLDWQFGDMPSLEEGIASRLRWKEDIREKGHRTLPIGPIRWAYDEHGDLVATAIGSENGKPRNRVIAGFHPDGQVARLALSPGRSEQEPQAHALTPIQSQPQRAALHRVASQVPAEPGPTEPKSAAALVPQQTNGSLLSPAAASANTPTPQPHVDDTSRAGTYTIPYHSQPPTNSTLDDTRQGTSHTRLEQQIGTHAEGAMAAGTPSNRTDGQGTTHAIMEPSTVGQAAKEHPVQTEDHQPTMLEQAQQYAGLAVEQARGLPHTVMSAVGYGGNPAEEDEKVGEKVGREDPAVVGMDKRNVEEYLREQTRSHQAGGR